MNAKEYAALEWERKINSDTEAKQNHLRYTVDEFLRKMFCDKGEAINELLANKKEVISPENRALCSAHYSTIDDEERTVVHFGDIEFCKAKKYDGFSVVVKCPICGQRTVTYEYSTWGSVGYAFEVPEPCNDHLQYHCKKEKRQVSPPDALYNLLYEMVHDIMGEA